LRCQETAQTSIPAERPSPGQIGLAIPDPAQRARTELVERLRARLGEIDAAVWARVSAVAGQPEPPEYADGVRAAVHAAVEYCIATLQAPEGEGPPIPTALLAQARLSARSGASLDTVLRRYCAGNTLFGDFLVQESEKGELLEDEGLKRLLRDQGSLFDDLLAAVSAEYTREAEIRFSSSGEHRAERVQRLLAGELIDTAGLAYEFEATNHLGLVAKGAGAEAALRELISPLDCRLLLLPREQETVWAWLGTRRKLGSSELRDLIAPDWPDHLLLALGESGKDLRGWRQTHRQARAAMQVALRDGTEPIARYAEVALLASALQDDLLSASLRRLYLEPLEGERDGGELARETLRTYFALECNASCTAAALGLSRQAVSGRLRAIEERIGRPLGGCWSELEVALRIEKLPSSHAYQGA
jgi:hypothetical protein